MSLEVTSQQLSRADAARNSGFDVSTVIKLRRVANDGALAAFAASKPGMAASIEQVEKRVNGVAVGASPSQRWSAGTP